MRVAMYYANDDVRLEELPRPKIGPGEILMRVEASGICGSDVMEWYRFGRVPLVLGHEISGVVVEAGEGVVGFKTGDRIVAAHHVPCQECSYCKRGHPTVCETLRKTNFYPGGFAEFVRLPEINVKKGTFLLPDSVSFEDGTFTEPLACVLRGQRIAGLAKGDTVLVVGSGMSGMLHINLAKALGAAKVIATDISDYKLALAKKFGATDTINSSEDVLGRILEINNGVLADVVIICASSIKAIEQALRSVCRGGKVLFFAAAGKDAMLPLSINDIFWRTEVTLTSSYAGSPGDHIEAIKLIETKKVNVHDMITHRFGLGETQRGFELVASGKESLKVIIKP